MNGMALRDRKILLLGSDKSEVGPLMTTSALAVLIRPQSLRPLCEWFYK